MKNILILGASTTGAIIANKLTRELRKEIAKGEVRITALDKSTCCSVNQAGYTFVPFGYYTPEDLKRPIKKMVSPRVRLFLGEDGEVTKIDLENRKVFVASGKVYNYDYLVIATGASPDLNIKGLSKDFHSFYTSLEDAQKLGKVINSFNKGRIVILTVKMPIPCPGAPAKFTVLLDDYLRYVKGEDVRKNIEISFLWPVKSIGPPAYNKVISHVLEEKKKIDVRREFSFDSVDESTKEVISTNGDRVKYDLLITIPPYKCNKFLIDSGLTDESGWIPTDKYTLQYKKSETEVYEEVYVVGDSGPASILKTGVSAHYQALITAQNIIHDIYGNGIKVPYRGETGCPIVTSSYTTHTRGEAYLATWTYGTPLEPFIPTKLGWFAYRMYYYLYWDATIKALM